MTSQVKQSLVSTYITIQKVHRLLRNTKQNIEDPNSCRQNKRRSKKLFWIVLFSRIVGLNRIEFGLSWYGKKVKERNDRVLLKRENIPKVWKIGGGG